MSIKVTFEFDTAADAAAFLQDFDGAPAGESPAPRKARAPKAAAPAAQPAAAASAAVAPATAAQPATASAVPFKEVADKITALSDVDYDKAVAVLAQFGVKSARDLKPEQFAGVVEAATKALAPAPTQSLV